MAKKSPDEPEKKPKEQPKPLTPAEFDAFRKFLKGKKVLIADTNASSRTSVSKLFNDMGAPLSYQLLASNYSEALQAVREEKPQVVVSDYNIDERCGLELIPEHRAALPEQDGCLFVLVTRNSSESAVAEAAEEDVDAYVLKPFTGETFQRYVVRSALDKLRPGGYREKLSLGKEKLFTNRFEDAMQHFKEAMELESKPSLACYYMGQTHEKMNQDDSAETDYKKGLGYNDIHYKCAVALFDLLVRTKRNEDAYTVVEKISQYFPISALRLGKAIELAVRTHHFDDIPRFYEIFKGLEDRHDDLRKYVSAALVVGARYLLQQNKNEEALALLQNAATTSNSAPAILKEIVALLCNFSLTEPATGFLKKFPATERKGKIFLTAEYILNDKLLKADALVPHGQSLVREGLHDPTVYQILIRRQYEVKHRDEAETLTQEAIKRWPAQADTFRALWSKLSG